jgi:hypothetical protein
MLVGDGLEPFGKKHESIVTKRRKRKKEDIFILYIM